ANERQRLQVVSESAQRVRVISVVGVVFQWVADFENEVVVAVDIVVDKRVVHPLADFMRQSRHIRREGAWTVHVGSVRVGLAPWLGTIGVVIAADAATKLSQKDVIGDENWQNTRVDLSEVLYVGLQLRVESVGVVGADDPASPKRVVEHLAQRSWNGNGLRCQDGRFSQQDVIAGVRLDVLPEVAALESVDVLCGS